MLSSNIQAYSARQREQRNSGWKSPVGRAWRGHCQQGLINQESGGVKLSPSFDMARGLLS